MTKVFVVGVGMTRFEKPGVRNWDYPDMAREAATKAMIDAKISYSAIEQACVGYVYGDSGCGQRAVYELGLSGIPIYNVNNNCSTGSTALYMAYQFVRGGQSQCVLALGFEKMQRGSLKSMYDDRANPIEKHMGVMLETRGFAKAPPAPQMFGNAGLEYMEKYNLDHVVCAAIAEKNHRHSANNPYSQFRDVYTLAQIQASPLVYGPLTKLQCCPTSEGAAAAIVCSEAFVQRHGLAAQAVEIDMAMATDLASTFDEKSCVKMVGFDMSRKAAQQAMAMAKVTPKDIQVIELHDCFSANELITYEALGLCGEGGAGKLILSGAVTYGPNSKYVVNPSGGLISKGHPLGATGLAQCAEICWQLRQMATNRQVAQARCGLSHNLGLGGACVVTVYKAPRNLKPFTGAINPAVSSEFVLVPPAKL